MILIKPCMRFDEERCNKSVETDQWYFAASAGVDGTGWDNSGMDGFGPGTLVDLLCDTEQGAVAVRSKGRGMAIDRLSTRALETKTPKTQKTPNPNCRTYPHKV